jgi:DUF4097 and DUF4098 domain-containing protein YvlB
MKVAAPTPFVLVVFVALGLAQVSSAGDGRSISKVNDSVTASAGNTYDSISTVNGDVHVERGVTAGSANTVNGSITLEDDARIGRASTVNGSIEAGTNVSISEAASTVNGGLRFARNSKVGGELSSVSGDIELAGAEVTGLISTVNGDIDLTDGAHARGGIHVRKPNRTGFNRPRDPVKVHVCSTCVVDGELRFDRPVELRVDNGGRIGKVIGEDVTRP